MLQQLNSNPTPHQHSASTYGSFEAKTNGNHLNNSFSLKPSNLLSCQTMPLNSNNISMHDISQTPQNNQFSEKTATNNLFGNLKNNPGFTFAESNRQPTTCFPHYIYSPTTEKPTSFFKTTKDNSSCSYALPSNKTLYVPTNQNFINENGFLNAIPVVYTFPNLVQLQQQQIQCNCTALLERLVEIFSKEKPCSCHKQTVAPTRLLFNQPQSTSNQFETANKTNEQNQMVMGSEKPQNGTFTGFQN